MSQTTFNSNLVVNSDININGTTTVNTLFVNGISLPFTNWTDGQVSFTGGGQNTTTVTITHNLGGTPTFASGIVSSSTENFAVTVDSWNTTQIVFRIGKVNGTFTSTNTLYWSSFR